MYFLLRKYLGYKTFNAIIRLYSLARKNHYEVLKVRKNCTDKEIKEAFIKLCKQFHPDKNKDVAAHAKFVQVLEAYNILSKPTSRANYDSMSNADSMYGYKSSEPYTARRKPYSNNYNYQYYYETYQRQTQNTQNTAKNNAFYGMSGIKSVPNYIIILMCCGVALLGCFLQMCVIREMYVVQQKQALAKSKHLGEELERVRAAAQGNGNDVQSKLLLDKIVSAANPTVATASLGHALANERK